MEEKTHETEPRVVPTDRHPLCSYLLWDCSLHLLALGGPCLEPLWIPLSRGAWVGVKRVVGSCPMSR